MLKYLKSLRHRTRKLRKITSSFWSGRGPRYFKGWKSFDSFYLTGLEGMIYLADPSGKEKNVKRIGFVGQFNATPRFSPKGSEIVFSSWMDNSFDIFKIKKDGSQIYRLTKNFGSNEEPIFSPDGEFIAFSSLK